MATNPVEYAPRGPRQRIRKATARDAAAVAALVASPEDLRQVSPLESFPLDGPTVMHWILERDAGYVLEDRGEIVAYGELVPDGSKSDRVWIGHMIVHPRRRGLGFGQRLVHELIRIAEKERFARVVAISAFADNARALRCYESCGFHPVDEERVGGRPLVGMRLKFRSRRRSPGAGMQAWTGAIAIVLTVVAWWSHRSAVVFAVPVVMVLSGLAVWRLGKERRHSWSKRMRSALAIAAVAWAVATAVGLALAGFLGDLLLALATSTSATLIWIALMAGALRLQK